MSGVQRVQLYSSERTVVERCIQDGRAVICKKPFHDPPTSHDLRRIRNEYELATRCRGEGVLAPEELVEQGSTLVLRFADHGLQSMDKSLDGPLGLDRFFHWAAQITEAVLRVHAAGVTHRDVKPQNILVDHAADRLHLIDFDAASKLSRQQQAPINTTAVGTLAYIAPEQTGRSNRAVDWRCDIYSLGITFYQMLTGRLPFAAEDALGWMHCHLAKQAPPPEQCHPDVPQQLGAVVLRCMAKLPEERYQSALGLLSDLTKCQQRWQQSGSIAAFELAADDRSMCFEVSQKIYGRDEDISTLLQSYQRVADGGKPMICMVSGYSGMGKTSLIRELYGPVVERKGFFITGKFDQYRRHLPYATLLQALSSLVQQLLEACDDRELGQWQQRITQAVGENGGVITEVVPAIEKIIGPQPPVPELLPAEAQNRFNLVFSRLFSVFCTEDHPLTLFLDDLQWVDMASLKLLKHLLTQSDVLYFFVIGAYRDNEVSSSHPLILALEELNRATVEINHISLRPLAVETIAELVADSFFRPPSEVLELASLLHKKTSGNPFFLIQFLDKLYADECLRLDPSSGFWSWDIKQIETRGYTDNVVDLMLGKLRGLPPSCQESLKIAACLGNTFQLKDLALVVGDGEEALRGVLQPAVQIQIVVEVGDSFCFVHDRIQQAVYALVPGKSEAAQLRLRIGRTLLEHWDQKQRVQRVFDITNQFDGALELVEDEEESLQLAQLYHLAGVRAHASGAHESAVEFLSRGVSLLPDNAWSVAYQLAYDLNVLYAESLFLVGRHGDSESCFDGVLRRSDTALEKARIFRTKAELATARSDLAAAIPLALEGLSMFGIRWQANPTDEEVQAEYDLTKAKLRSMDASSIAKLPPLSDEDIGACMQLLLVLQIPAYFTDHNLLALTTYRMVNLTLQYGPCDASINGMGWYGLIVQDRHGLYQEGWDYVQLARSFMEQYGFHQFEHYVYYFLELSNIWVGPIQDSVDFACKSYLSGLRNGNVLFSAFACNHSVVNILMSGTNLEVVAQECDRWLEYPRRVGYLDVEYVIISIQRYVRHLLGETRGFDSWDDDGFDLDAFEKIVNEERVTTVACWHNIMRMISFFHMEDYPSALAASKAARELLFSSLFHPQLFLYHFFSALCLAACASSDESLEARSSLLQEIKAHGQQIEMWASSNPGYFSSSSLLVQAEVAGLEGKDWQALLLYEQSLTSARDNGLVQNEALASELVSHFFRQRGLTTPADNYLSDARSCYRAWGATAKVTRLEEKYPGVTWQRRRQVSTMGYGDMTLPREKHSTSYPTATGHLDALSLIKAGQALSSEIKLEALLERLLDVLLENAAAQYASLIMVVDEKLVLKAHSDVENGIKTVSTWVTGQNASFPLLLVHRVWQEKTALVFEDISRDNPFAADAYFQNASPRSLCCLPLMSHERLVGIVYLENRLSFMNYTGDRIQILELLAAQAAISLENSQLYNNMEARVEERTQVLKETQTKLVDASRRAGMAEIASNILHNVGNLLNSVNVASELIGVKASTLSLDKLARINNLLDAESEDFVAFIENDARGKMVPAYLQKVTGVLEQERDEMVREARSLREKIDHIKVVINRQQAYVGSSSIVERIPIESIVDDAIAINNAAFQDALQQVEICTDYSDAPPIGPVPKHQILQILVNLISNASYACIGARGEKRIDIRVYRESEKRWAVSVKDSGCGIASEDKAKLFTHGFSTRADGHGFGLHDSANLATQIKATLSFDSEGKGKGAEFKLCGPLSTLSQGS